MQMQYCFTIRNHQNPKLKPPTSDHRINPSLGPYSKHTIEEVVKAPKSCDLKSTILASQRPLKNAGGLSQKQTTHFSIVPGGILNRPYPVQVHPLQNQDHNQD